MLAPINLTVGDTGVTMSGTITQKQLGQLQQSDLVNCSAKFSILHTSGGTPVVNEATATIVSLDAPNNTVTLSYRLQAADVATPVADGYMRWTFILPDAGKIHAPGDPDQRTPVRINA